jgi:uncharacterized alkaline shock family protein YloU
MTMSETPTLSDAGRTTGDTGQRRTTTSASPANALQSTSSQGRTTIENAVVAKIAGIATREVDGVRSLEPMSTGSAISGLASGLTARVRGDDQNAQAQGSQNVRVEVGEREAAVDLAITVDYGVSIPQVAEGVRRNIINRVAAMTGLTVKEVNIDVTDLYFPQDQSAASAPRVQ